MQWVAVPERIISAKHMAKLKEMAAKRALPACFRSHFRFGPPALQKVPCSSREVHR